MTFGKFNHFTNCSKTSDLFQYGLWALPVVNGIGKKGHYTKNMSFEKWTYYIRFSCRPTTGYGFTVGDASEEMQRLMSLHKISFENNLCNVEIKPTLAFLASSISPPALNNSEAVAWGSDLSNSAQSTLLNSGDTALSKLMTRLSTSFDVRSSTHESIAARLL